MVKFFKFHIPLFNKTIEIWMFNAPQKCGNCGKPMRDNNPIHTKECFDYYEAKRKNERPEIN